MAPILAAKLGWDLDGTEEIKTTLIQTSGMAGIAIGTAMAGIFLKLNGKKNLNYVVFTTIFV